MMEDDDGDFLAAAREDDALVAKLLVRLSRSETCVAWRRLPVPPSKPPAETDVPAAPPVRPPTGGTTWGRRRARSAPVAAAKGEEEAGRASPATPLSWSGASGTSGSGSDDGWSTPPPRPPKRRRRRREGVHERGERGHEPQPASKQATVSCQGAEEEQIGAPPAQGTSPELSGGGGPAPTWGKVGSSDDYGEPLGDSVVGAATAAIGSPAAGSGSSKGAAVAVAAATREPRPTMSVAHAEPLRSRWTGEGARSVVFGRQARKKTVLELRATKDSLLREQEQLHKELGKQREIYVALLEENLALKKLESCLPSTAAGKQTSSLVCVVEAKSGEPQHLRPTSMWQAPKGIATASVHDQQSHEQHRCTSSSPPAPERTFLFDLNSLPDGDL